MWQRFGRRLETVIEIIPPIGPSEPMPTEAEPAPPVEAEDVEKGPSSCGGKVTQVLGRVASDQFNTKCNMHPDFVADRRLAWYSPYGLSSFTFCVLGVLELTWFSGNFELNPVRGLQCVPDCDQEVGIPLQVEAAALFLQSLATLFADGDDFLRPPSLTVSAVLMSGKDSWWHSFDRVVAVINTIFVLCNAFWLPWLDRAVYVAILVSGVSLLATSRHSRIRGDITGVAFWHSVWHLWFPVGVGLWLVSRQYPTARIVIVGTVFAIAIFILVSVVLVRLRRRRKDLAFAQLIEDPPPEVAGDDALEDRPDDTPPTVRRLLPVLAAELPSLSSLPDLPVPSLTDCISQDYAVASTEEPDQPQKINH